MVLHDKDVACEVVLPGKDVELCERGVVIADVNK